MNIFILDIDPVLAGTKVNKYSILANKLRLENTQMISTLCNTYGITVGYESFNPSHCCNIWLTESKENVDWFIDYAESIFKANYYHKSYPIWRNCVNNLPELPSNGLTVPPLAFTDKESITKTGKVRASCKDLKELYGVKDYKGFTRGIDWDNAVLGYNEYIKRKWYS